MSATVDREFLARRMSKLFGRQSMSACACAGVPPCGNTQCAIWWDIVMKDGEVFDRVRAFYEGNKEWVERTAANCPPPYGPPTA